MRATCWGARSGRMAIATLPCVVSRTSVSSVCVIDCALFFDGGLFDVIEIGKVFLEVGVPFALNAALLRPATGWSAFAIAAVQRVHHIHSGSDLAERRKPLTIQARIVGKVDEHLAGAGIRARGRKGDVTTLVALPHGIVLDGRAAPRGRYSGVGIDPELHHEAADDPKKP